MYDNVIHFMRYGWCFQKTWLVMGVYAYAICDVEFFRILTGILIHQGIVPFTKYNLPGCQLKVLNGNEKMA